MRSLSLLGQEYVEAAKEDYKRGEELLQNAVATLHSGGIVDGFWHEIAICELLKNESEKAIQAYDSRPSNDRPDSADQDQLR